jgi:hypothetical protein
MARKMLTVDKEIFLKNPKAYHLLEIHAPNSKKNKQTNKQRKKKSTQSFQTMFIFLSHSISLLRFIQTSKQTNKQTN